MLQKSQACVLYLEVKLDFSCFANNANLNRSKRGKTIIELLLWLLSCNRILCSSVIWIRKSIFLETKRGNSTIYLAKFEP